MYESMFLQTIEEFEVDEDFYAGQKNQLVIGEIDFDNFFVETLYMSSFTSVWKNTSLEQV